jgi:hypothetical protein
MTLAQPTFAPVRGLLAMSNSAFLQEYCLTLAVFTGKPLKERGLLCFLPSKGDFWISAVHT